MSSKSSLEHKTDKLWKNHLTTQAEPSSPSNKFWNNYQVLVEKSKQASIAVSAPLTQKPHKEALIRDKFQVYWANNHTTLNGEIKLPKSHKVFNTYGAVTIFVFLIYLSLPENSIAADIVYAFFLFGGILMFKLSFLTRLSPQKVPCSIELKENHLLYKLSLESEALQVKVPYHQIKKFKVQGGYLKILVKNRRALTYSHPQKRKQDILIPFDIENPFYFKRFLGEIIEINHTKS
ncbi:MAG TPA: hypothetical protein DCS93_17055 [Microscillaceae bacterium]|nr:hypothetical protein [Microscillaceae bacterium]